MNLYHENENENDFEDGRENSHSFLFKQCLLRVNQNINQQQRRNFNYNGNMNLNSDDLDDDDDDIHDSYFMWKRKNEDDDVDIDIDDIDDINEKLEKPVRWKSSFANKYVKELNSATKSSISPSPSPTTTTTTTTTIGKKKLAFTKPSTTTLSSRTIRNNHNNTSNSAKTSDNICSNNNLFQYTPSPSLLAHLSSKSSSNNNNNNNNNNNKAIVIDRKNINANIIDRLKNEAKQAEAELLEAKKRNNPNKKEGENDDILQLEIEEQEQKRKAQEMKEKERKEQIILQERAQREALVAEMELKEARKREQEIIATQQLRLISNSFSQWYLFSKKSKMELIKFKSLLSLRKLSRLFRSWRKVAMLIKEERESQRARLEVLRFNSLISKADDYFRKKKMKQFLDDWKSFASKSKQERQLREQQDQRRKKIAMLMEKNRLDQIEANLNSAKSSSSTIDDRKPNTDNQPIKKENNNDDQYFYNKFILNLDSQKDHHQQHPQINTITTNLNDASEKTSANIDELIEKSPIAVVISSNTVTSSSCSNPPKKDEKDNNNYIQQQQQQQQQQPHHGITTKQLNEFNANLEKRRQQRIESRKILAEKYATLEEKKKQDEIERKRIELQRIEDEKRLAKQKRAEELKLERQKAEDDERRRLEFERKLSMAKGQYNKNLKKFFGINPWKRYIQIFHQSNCKADEFCKRKSLEITFLTWLNNVRELQRTKKMKEQKMNEKADVFYNKWLIKRIFENWFKEHVKTMETTQKKIAEISQKTKFQYYQRWKKAMAFKVLLEEARVEKLMEDAKIYSRSILMRYYFKCWCEGVKLSKLQRAEEESRALLRNEVKEWLREAKENKKVM